MGKERGKRWVVWGVVGVVGLVILVAIGGTWVYLRGRERAQRAEPLQEEGAYPALPTVGEGDLAEIKEEFETTDWIVKETSVEEIVLQCQQGDKAVFRVRREMLADPAGAENLRVGDLVDFELNDDGTIGVSHR